MGDRIYRRVRRLVGRSDRSSAGSSGGDCAAVGGARAEFALSLFFRCERLRHEHMRELRVQSRGNPLRVFYAFDPRRTAILLIGGNKTGNNRFYEQYIPIADALYDTHLEELRAQG